MYSVAVLVPLAQLLDLTTTASSFEEVLLG